MGLYKREKTWYIQYFADGRRRREAIGPSKRQAELVLAKRKAEIREGRYFDVPSAGHLTFRALADRFVRDHVDQYYAPTSKRAVRYSLGPLLDAFGARAAASLNAGDVTEFLAGIRAKGKKPSTVNRYRGLLSSIYSAGVRWRLVPTNPIGEVKLLREQQGRVRFLMPDETARLLRACDSEIRPFVTVALHTGLRSEELRSLCWDSVDRRAKAIHVVKTKSRRPRTVPMNDTAWEVLTAQPRYIHCPYVFTWSDGVRPPYSRVYKRFQRAVRAAHLEPLRFHDLRHTFASNLVMAGADLTTVRELLGHQRFDMTLRYAHLAPSHTRAAVEALGRILQP